MSASRKILKVIGIITIFAAVLQLIAGGVIIAGAGLMEARPSRPTVRFTTPPPA